jgi:hypothetical protein
MLNKLVLMIPFFVLLSNSQCARKERKPCSSSAASYDFPLQALGKRVQFCLPLSYKLSYHCMQDGGYSFCFIKGASNLTINFPYNEPRPFPAPNKNYLEAYKYWLKDSCENFQYYYQKSYNELHGGLVTFACADSIVNYGFFSRNKECEYLIEVEAELLKDSVSTVNEFESLLYSIQVVSI